MNSEQKFFKKNGYLIKKNLINKKTIDKINKVVNEVVAKEKQKNKKKDNNGTQSYDNYHFVYNSNSSKNKEILRLNNPQNRHKIFYDLSRNKKIISIVKKLIGGSVRFHLGKLNFKLPNKKKGSEVGWHQDWAFYPHTNDDLIAIGIYLEDCYEKNGPLKVIPGSHKLKIFDHHQNGYFVGKINTKKEKINTKKSVSLVGAAGSVTFHHVRTLHSSALNLTKNFRPLLLYGYSSVDSWPVYYDQDSSINPNINLKAYDKLILKGKPTLIPRLKNVPIIMPLPRESDSIFQLQNQKK